jgi:hypothetical protein
VRVLLRKEKIYLPAVPLIGKGRNLQSIFPDITAALS